MTCGNCGAPTTPGLPCLRCGATPSPGPVPTRPTARRSVLVAVLLVLGLVVAGTVVLAVQDRTVAGTQTVGDPRPAVGETDPTTDPTTAEPDVSSSDTAPTPSSPSTRSAAPGTTADPAPSDVMRIGVAYADSGDWPGSSTRDAAESVAELRVTDGLEILEAAASSYEPVHLVEVLQDLTDQGADAVVALGDFYTEAAEEVAEANPDVEYVVVDGYRMLPNLRTVNFAEEESAFLAGVAAALVSTSDEVGFLAAADTPWVHLYEVGFTAGVEAAKPGASVRVEYLGDLGDAEAWDDREAAADLAGAWYADGIDVIMTLAGYAEEGVIDAALQAVGDKWVVGAFTDLYATSEPGREDVVLTSAVTNFAAALPPVVQALQDGEPDRIPRVLGVAEDAVGYSVLGGHLDEYVDEIDDWAAKIADGEIVVPYD